MTMLFEGPGDGHSGTPTGVALNDYGNDKGDNYKNASYEGTNSDQGEGWPSGEGYEAGDPYDDSGFDVPGYVMELRDELNMVRDAESKIYNAMYVIDAGGMSRPDPIDQMRQRQALDSLQKEEERLMLALRDAEWILPPLMEPPHNMPTQEKAKAMLRDGTANGKPLSSRQRGLFGVIASGKKPKVASKKSY